jgi:glycosyltransferase involved in cell wall biosynthesis
MGTAGAKLLRLIYAVSEGVDFRRARFQQIFQTVHALARQDCEVDLLIGNNRGGQLSEALPYYGLSPHENLRIHPIPMLRREKSRLIRLSWGGVFLWFCSAKVRRLVKEKAYDALYTRHLRPASLFLKLKGYLRINILFEAHEIFHLTTERKDKLEKIRREEFLTYSRMDGILSITRGLAEKMKELFALQAPMAVVPDGVNLYFFGGSSRPARDKKVVYVGQLYPWKGTDTLVEAMPDLPGGELHVVGGGEDRIQALREKAARLGVAGRIFFHGQVSPQEVKAHLEDAAVAVLPLGQDLISASFTSPLKLFEYMAARVPIVASDLPSIREVLTHGVNAILVPPGDPRALTEGIRELLEDRPLADKIAEKAFEDVQEYTWEKRAQKIIRFLQSLPKGG